MNDHTALVAGPGSEEARTVPEPVSFETFFEREAQMLFRRLCAVTGNPIPFNFSAARIAIP